MAMIRTRVANSDGWSCSGPMGNQRWEPFELEPRPTSTATSATTMPM